MKATYRSILFFIVIFIQFDSHAQCAGVEITMNILSQTDVSCNGGDDGTALIEGQGGTEPYTYIWSPGGLLGPSQSNLAADEYIVTITDFNGCDSTDTVFILEPTVLVASGSSTPATCGSADGSATGFGSGGAGGYTYSWFPIGGNNQIATGLVPGDYTLTVTDQNSCTDDYVVNVPAIGGPTVVPTSVTHVSCNGGNDGVITVTAGGGASPYTFSWIPGGLTGDTVENLSAGVYTVTVTDASGCSNSSDVTVLQPNPLNLSQGTVNSATCLSNDGSAEVSVSGGTSPYTYLWSSGGTNSNEPDLFAGIYTVVVTDDKGCSDSLMIGVPNTGGPTVTVNSMTPVSCYGYTDGEIDVLASGGSGNYIYQWYPTGGNNSTATGLGQGSYTVIVTDDSGCIGILTTSVGSPNEIVITETIVDEDCGEANGAIFVTASGGAGGLTYLWSTGSTSTSITNIVHGTYALSVTDFDDCTQTELFTVDIFGNIPITATPETSSIYAGDPVDLNASGGIVYTWEPDYAISCTDCPNPTVNPLVDTFYIVTGYDENDCFGTDTVWVDMLAPCEDFMMPTIFSPNGDDLNDNLCVLGTCIAEMELRVFNRWGQMIFSSNTVGDCWDGTHNDKTVMSGIYAYQVSVVLLDGTVFEEEGQLTVVR